MEYKVGDRVRIKSIDWYNKYKNEDGDVSCGEFNFVEGMKKFCSETLTISEDAGDGYLMLEDYLGYVWTDEMFECKVEEETKLKFKVGDKITNGKVTLTILTLSSDRYIVEDNFGKCGILYFTSQDGWKIVEEESIIDLTVKGEEVKERIEVTIPEGYEYVIESGKIIFTKKKKEYPKTFEECVSVLMCKGGNRMPLELMNTFRKLIDARNAYWTIYGEENGLGKPWEPTMETVYCISRNENVMKCSYRGGKSNVLEFPTAEMRDAFYENFKKEIEICKELL